MVSDSSLFSASRPARPSYTAEDIDVLEGLDPVRKRPGMYIGGTDGTALHHLAFEILDNGMDEVVAGFARKIEVRFDEGAGTLTIADDGRGIPFDPHPKFPGRSALEVILGTLHSGGKFKTNVYKTSGGLHGVGLSVVNALSDSLEIEVVRDGTKVHQSYSRGKPLGPLVQESVKTARHGTKITFHPDPEIFGDEKFHAKKLFEMARSKAYLVKGVAITWAYKPARNTEMSEATETAKDEATSVPLEAVFAYPQGLESFLQTALVDDLSSESYGLFSGDVAFSDQSGRIEWAVALALDPGLTWPLGSMSFCNTIPTPLGGTHEAGFRQGLLKALKAYGDMLGNKKIDLVTNEDLERASVRVLSCFVEQPQFQGQTKEKLTSVGVQKLVETAIKDYATHWLAGQSQLAAKIIAALVEVAEARIRSRQKTKEESRLKQISRLRLPGKLADSLSQNPAECELFLVEGDSAGGSAKQARDRKTQAVLPLRGKILNVTTASFEKLKQNQEITDLTVALGCGVHKNCDPQKLRYHKIIIMTDADVDGAHIASLLLAFFFQEMYAILEGGFVYLACPPLYRLSTASQTVYARDDEEKEAVLKKQFRKNQKVEMSRFKGLGEMSVAQLRATTMAPESRPLIRVTVHDFETCEEFLQRIMGRNPESRFHFIQEKASFVEGLDI